jgi:hypothetical protein
MAGLNDMIRSAFPGGNVAKPLMLALGALLASGELCSVKAQDRPPARARNRRRTRVTPAECLADWADC